MTMCNKLERSKILFWIINLGVASIFFIFNFLTPLFGDDFIYQNIFGTNQRVESFVDIIQSQITHYNTWGGRAIVYTIDQFFLMYDKQFFNVANSIIFMIFSLLIYFHVYGTEISNTFLIIVYTGLWFSIPGVGYSIIWQTMSCNYLWGSTIILAFFTPYYLSLYTSRQSSLLTSVGIALLMFLFGIIAGWTIEAGGAMLLLGIALILILQKKTRQQIRIWELTGFIGALIGYLLLIAAPGNYARSAQVMAENNHGSFSSNLLIA